MTHIAVPRREEDIVELLISAKGANKRVAICGGGSKAAIGTPVQGAIELDLRGFAGVVDYDPAELVLTVKAGTLLAEVQSLLAGHNQMLAFDPFDHGPIFGQPSGAATMGGVVAAGVAGSQRLSHGSARDHLLGFRAVSGRGEIFRAGAKVVKNVTGYDLPKLAAGSWGRLFVITELTLKLLPKPVVSRTFDIAVTNADQAIEIMANAMASRVNVAAAAYLPAAINGGRGACLLRLQGFESSVAARCATLLGLLRGYGQGQILSETASGSAWKCLQTLDCFETEIALWRVNVAPSKAPMVISDLDACGAKWLLDWAGGLIWVAFAGDASVVRRSAEAAGGHAALIRASEGMRISVAAMHPPSKALAALEARVRRAFDPDALFETGRF